MADKSKDTGTGGINIDGQVYVPDVGVPDTQGGAQGTYSPGDVAVDKAVKDISRPTRETFAKYLSKTTLGTAGDSPHGNTYPVGLGAATVLQEMSLKDSNGNPVSPGPQNNEAKFAAGFNTSIASNNPAGVRRGLATGSGPDGHTLLPNARKADGTLEQPIQNYTATAIAPNLRNYGDYTANKKSANLSGDAQEENLYDLHRTTDLATDGGTSSNILNPTKSVSFASEAELVKTSTTTNFFPVDSPVVNNTLKVFKLDSSVVLAATGNSKSFADISVGSSVPIVSKGNLKRKDANNNDLPDGNSLLPNASTKGPSGGDYVKFVTSTDDGKEGLQAPVKAYTSETTKPNLNNYNSLPVVIPEYEGSGAPSGIRDLNKTTTFAADAGTSKNLLGNQRKLSLVQVAKIAFNKTKDNAYPIDLPVVITNASDGSETITPISVTSTSVLASPSNTNYFANIAIGSYAAVNSKGKLKNIGSEKLSLYKDKILPDGNSLLPNASTPAPSGGPYVKFVTSTNTEGLLEPIKVYTNNLLDDGNIYRPSSEAVIDLNNIAALNFFGPNELHRPESGPTDAGTFDNIQSDPSKRAVTKELLFQRAVDEVTGKNAPGSIGNVYKLNVLAPPTNLFSFTTNDGTPVSPTNLQDATENLLQYAPPSADVTLQSSYSDYSANLNIRRGKSVANVAVPDGNTLLKNAAVPVVGQTQFIKTAKYSSTAISDYVKEILGKNRYSSLDGKNKFVPDDTPYTNDAAREFNQIQDYVADKDRSISFVQRTKLYSPHELQFGESPQQTINRGTELKGYNFRSLTRIGTLLQFRAAGEGPFMLIDYPDTRGNVAELANLLPGLGQAVAGAPIKQEYLKVKEIIKELPNEKDDGDGNNNDAQYEGELIDFNTHFEGIVNHTSERFSAYSSIAIFVLAIILVIVVIVAIQLIALALSTSSTLNQESKYPHDSAAMDINNIRGFGSYKGRRLSGGTNIINDLVEAITTGNGAGTLFGIRSTYNRPYNDAVFTGAVSFFGLGKKIPPMLAFPGQTVVTARAIIRSVTKLIYELERIGVAFASGNVLDGIFKLLGIIESVRNSKFIGAINTFSQLGDREPIKILSSRYALDIDESIGLQAADGQSPDTVTQELFGSNKVLFEKTREDYDVGRVVSEIDAILDQDAIVKVDNVDTINPSYVSTAHIKSRRKNITGLAWAAYRAPSLYLQPLDDQELNQIPDAPNPRTITSDFGQQQLYISDISGKNRIPNETVDKLENALDGEHVPFYFHDLRTNEIISFHAFLMSLSDDYSANYESTTGIGRIEAVKTYKDTTRKIGLSFMLAATDRNDFDVMWEKINKLTMLVYPQFTKGKIYENPNTGYRFEKPFTQMIAASPMIRLRVGNLFTTNYSRFNLAGIFGLHDKTSKTGFDEDTRKSVEDARKAEAQKKLQEDAAAAIEKSRGNWIKDNAFNKALLGDQAQYSPKPGVYFSFVSATDAANISAADQNELLGTTKKPPQVQQTQQAAAAFVRAANPHYTTNAKKEFSDWYRVTDKMYDTFYFKLEKIYNDASGKPFLAKGTFKGKKETEKPSKPANAKAQAPIDYDTGTKTYFIPVANLKPNASCEKFLQDKATKLINTGPLPSPTVNVAGRLTKSDFMDKEKNIIVKSFESVGGKGLAGFIDSINFDWYEGATWDLDTGRKAPKLCKVTISFSPVHDIAPGLDAYGQNRAPIYSLGPFNGAMNRNRYNNAKDNKKNK